MGEPTKPINPPTAESRVIAAKQAFYNEYLALCKKHGYQIMITPKMKLQSNNGLNFYVTTLDITVEPITKPIK